MTSTAARQTMIGVYTKQPQDGSRLQPHAKGCYAQSTLLPPPHASAHAKTPESSESSSGSAARKRKDSGKSVATVPTWAHTAYTMNPHDALDAHSSHPREDSSQVTLLSEPVCTANTVIDFQRKANAMLRVENAACSPIFQSMPYINLKMRLLHSFANTQRPPQDNIAAFTGVGYIVRYTASPQPRIALERRFPGVTEFDNSKEQCEDNNIVTEPAEPARKRRTQP